jgi:hypothetical protein
VTLIVAAGGLTALAVARRFVGAGPAGVGVGVGAGSSVATRRPPA